jgi:hypothetical protein
MGICDAEAKDAQGNQETLSRDGEGQSEASSGGHEPLGGEDEPEAKAATAWHRVRGRGR